MMKRTLLVLTLVCLGAAVSLADDGSDRSEKTPNLLVSFTVGEIEKGAEKPLKSYEMLLEANGRPAEMMTGARVPIPVTTFNTRNEDDNSVVPVTSFSYQNVGFTATVEAHLRHDGRIRFNCHIEDSSMAESTADHGRPIIQTLTQRIQATLDDGVPIRINKIEESNTRSLFIQVQVDVLDN